MDHAINHLRSYMQSSINIHQSVYAPKEDIKLEIQAYVDAINKLEIYYYGEKITSLDVVLAFYK